jgi:hypothetical protein
MLIFFEGDYQNKETIKKAFNSNETIPLKVHKSENFFGYDFELFTSLWLVMPNYYFLE